MTSFLREPFSEARADFGIILGSLFWKEIKGGKNTSSKVQSCVDVPQTDKWFPRTTQRDQITATCKGVNHLQFVLGMSNILGSSSKHSWWTDEFLLHSLFFFKVEVLGLCFSATSKLGFLSGLSS